MRKIIESDLECSLILNDGEFKSFFTSLDVRDRRFVRERISHYPRKIQRIVIDLYRNEATLFEANTRLRTLTEKLDSIIPPILINYFDSGEQELRVLADDMANRCREIGIRETRSYSLSTVNASRRVNTLESVYQRCADFVNGKDLNAPEINSKQSIEGCIKRMQDKGWWLRRLRKLLNRSRETVLIELNQVNKLKGIYCSDLTAAHRKHQKQQQLKMLESLMMTNEVGEQFSLRDIYDVNVSNPTIRRNELMTRIRGFEDISKEMEHTGVFVTLTCPSKYHNAYAKSGQRNPKWQGLTPYDGQQYLCNTWAKMRAQFDRQDIRTYGLRVAEPQHDGTPHWHLMLFVEKHQAEQLKAIMEHYSFEEDGDEQGAKENRVKFVDIDPNKGSATGYVAKYVCKNIDGADLDTGVYGEDPILAAQRVEVWASCWGIRQFQQIGGVSVTVWRELRRLRKHVYEDETLTELRNAADSGNWASYTKLMGGVFCIRKSQAIRPYYEMELNKETGLIKTSWFDGLITKKLKGILYQGKEIITRIHQWKLDIVRQGFSPSLGVL